MTRTPFAHRLTAVLLGAAFCLGGTTAAQADECGRSAAFGRVQVTCEVPTEAAAVEAAAVEAVTVAVAEAAPVAPSAPAAPATRTASAATQREIVAADGTVGTRPEGAVRQAAARRIRLTESVMRWNVLAARLA